MPAPGCRAASCNAPKLPAMQRRSTALPPGAEERLTGKGIGMRLDGLGPGCRVGTIGRAVERGRRVAVSGHLLHVVVELDAVAVRVEHVCGVVDARIQIRRHA